MVCELGTQATNLSGKTLLLSALDWFTPAPMQSRIEIFKEAANEGYPVHICKSKYYCDSQNLIQTRRKWRVPSIKWSELIPCLVRSWHYKDNVTHRESVVSCVSPRQFLISQLWARRHVLGAQQDTAGIQFKSGLNNIWVQQPSICKTSRYWSPDFNAIYFTPLLHIREHSQIH